MANLTEEELNSVSEALGITKDLLRDMTKEELLLEFETGLQKLELEVVSKKEEISSFRVENFKLRIANFKLCIASSFLRLGCFIQQARIGAELAIQDVETFLRIK